MKKPKMTRNMSKRDQNMLLLLAFVLIIFVIYYIVIGPQFDKGKLLAEEARSAKTEYENSVEIINKLPDIKKEELEKKNILSEKYKQFFYEVNIERILYKLDSLLSGAGLPMSSMTISKPSVGVIVTEKAEYIPLTYPLLELAAKSNDTLINENDSGVNSNEQTSDSKEGSNDVTAYTDINLSFSSTSYESAYGFIDSIEKMDRTIIIKNIDLRESGNGIDGSLLLSVYSIAKPNQLDENDLEFDPVLPKGKANPFS